VRYPRGEGVGVELPEIGDVLKIGRGRIVREGQGTAILSLGTRLADAMRAADQLEDDIGPVTVADARFAKPMDTDLLDRLAQNHVRLLIVEENSPGGFSAHVLQYLANAGHLDGGLTVRCLSLPDRLIDHDSQAGQLALAGIDADGIAETLRVMNGGTDSESTTKAGPAASKTPA
jgi:1-deoxy-D-xylulose-5-phosphate synthase